jgi:acyl-CoA reductase-like NAD-dependent aldehyde dehydrogenase
MFEKKHYINGNWVPGRSGTFIEVENPSTNRIIAKVPRGNQEDVNDAVTAAREAFKTWQYSSLETRLTLMEKVVQGLNARRGEIIETITKELGTPYKVSRDIHTDPFLLEAATFIETARNFNYESQRPHSIVCHEPVGVVVGLTPWNFPLEQIEKKVVPALLAGNCIVLKPSQLTPLTAYILAELIDEAGYPKGVFNMLTGTGNEMGKLLASREDVDMVSFTGSTGAGREVARMGLTNIKKLALELGGKSAAVVLPDADYEMAVKSVLDNVYLNSGQTCNATTRIVIPRKEQNKIEKLILQQTENYKFGPAEDKDTDIATLSSKKQYDKVKQYIEIGIAEGARMLLGEIPCEPQPGKGYYVKPVVFSDVTSKMRIAQEEIFGPVLVIQAYDTKEEAVEIANDSAYGLGGSVFGSPQEALEVARKIRTGSIYVNDGLWDVNSPFGGYKQSGLGREGGPEGYAEFLEIKTIYTQQKL